MGKDKDHDDKDVKDNDKDDKKEVAEEYKGPIYTGEGYIPIDTLVENVKAWQQRKILCEDVDYLERQGGTDP